MELAVGYLEPLSNQILNPYNMHLEIERIKKDLLELFG
jgi:hypothetical protein